MTTKLDRDLKREITVEGTVYTVLLTPSLLKLTEKGRRKGLEIKWKDLLSGDAGMAAALQASVAEIPDRRAVAESPATRSRPSKAKPKQRGTRKPAAR
ncbi:hypothetical protein [Hydrocarboniphaga effusa]|jgi:hypothetical protein|uniref:hypothetical protein n=1 Tax=Hydrocarboniphaga effusa TaxID=243629 RepID=UPI00398BD9C2